MTTGPWYKRLPFIHSRLGRLVVGLNIISLLILVCGTLVVNEFRRGLIDAYEDSLKSQAQTIGNLIGAVATGEENEAPHLQPYYAAQVMNRFIPQGQRARLFDINGKLVSDGTWIADSLAGSDRIDVTPLPPARKSTDPQPKDNSAEMARLRAQGQTDLQDELAMALSGTDVAHVRRNERGRKVVSVSIPIKRVKTVLGVLTLERGNVDEIVQAQRQAMVPFILMALGVTFISSIMLHFLITRPIQRLSLAADTVRANQARAISLPDLEERQDEIGGLARSLESMTDTLWRRMEEIDRFAADVAHEIKNPLTSIRSALETLSIVRDDTAKDRLMGVLNQDVRRLDRLITDISNASRLDAELSRDVPKAIDVGVLMEDIVSLYEHTGSVRVRLRREVGQATVSGREGPLGQVFRNVIDNARSFSSENGEVRVALLAGEAGQLKITIEDDGPGIPEENLETIFQRFYTSRPKGTSFGNNSGLGLSISRQIVEAHHGKIWAENRIEGGIVVGAKFTIVLPSA